MRPTARHREAEERFRDLLAGEDLPPPDEVGYEPDAVVFYWHDPKVAVFIDFEDEPVDVSSAGAPASRGPP